MKLDHQATTIQNPEWSKNESAEQIPGSTKEESVEQIPQWTKKEFVCTVCPQGCKITAAKTGNDEWVFEGYTCKRGLRYAEDEILHPKRTLTTTVLQKLKVKDGGRTVCLRRLVPVRSSQPIPLHQMMNAMEEIKRTILHKKVAEGEVIISDILGTKVDIIATST